MEKLFILNANPLEILLRFVVLFFAAVFIIWLYSCIRLKANLKINKSFKQCLYESLMEGILLCFVVLAIYLVVFIKVNGWQRFVWDEWNWILAYNTYFLLLPEIILTIIFSIGYWMLVKKYSKLRNK